eukprot:2713038-Prymnesium_polylepis.2
MAHPVPYCSVVHRTSRARHTVQNNRASWRGASATPICYQTYLLPLGLSQISRNIAKYRTGPVPDGDTRPQSWRQTQTTVGRGGRGRRRDGAWRHV